MKETLIVLKKIVSYSYSFCKKHIIIVFLMNVLKAAIPILIILNTQKIVDSIQISRTVSSEFGVYIFLFIILNLVLEFSNVVLQYSTIRCSDLLDYRFSMAELESINKKELSDFENSDFYDLIQRAERSSSIYPFQIITSIINIFSMGVSTIGFIIILSSWKWWAVVLVAIIPIISGIKIIKIGQNEYKTLYNRTNLERKSWYYANLLNKDLYIKETKLFSLEEYFFNKFKEMREAFIFENKKNLKNRTYFSIFFSMISIFIISILVYHLLSEVIEGKVFLGTLITYISSITTLRSNFSNIIVTFFQFHQYSLYAKDILELLEYKEETFRELLSIESIEKIELIDVSFRYKNSNRYALKNINLCFEKGRKYIILGNNGSGKTTLIKLMLGFYTNYDGCILVNGIDLKNIDLKQYREFCSAILQDFSKYQFTIEESIGLFDLKNDRVPKMDRLTQVTKISNLEKFVEKLDNKYQQQLGNWFPGGVQLSGGEWQKIALARAFYKKNSDLLILDEPTSALDNDSEKKFIQNCERLLDNKIGIFITHRIKHIDCEYIVVTLKDGSVIVNE